MTESRTILAFDFGNARVGVARVDTFVKIPEPLEVIARGDWEAFETLVDEHQPSLLVVGLPRSLDGVEHAQAGLSRQFADELATRLKLPVVLQDETLTSVSALDAKNTANSNASLDSLSACIILEDYLKEHV